MGNRFSKVVCRGRAEKDVRIDVDIRTKKRILFFEMILHDYEDGYESSVPCVADGENAEKILRSILCEEHITVRGSFHTEDLRGIRRGRTKVTAYVLVEEVEPSEESLIAEDPCSGRVLLQARGKAGLVVRRWSDLFQDRVYQFYFDYSEDDDPYEAAVTKHFSCETLEIIGEPAKKTMKARRGQDVLIEGVLSLNWVGNHRALDHVCVHSLVPAEEKE